MAKINKFRMFLVVLLLLQAPTILVSVSKLQDIYTSSRQEHLKLLTDQALEKHVASQGISMGEWRLRLEGKCRKERQDFVDEYDSGKIELSWLDTLAGPSEVAGNVYDLCARGGSYLYDFPTRLESAVFMTQKYYQALILSILFVVTVPAFLSWLVVFFVPFVLIRFSIWITAPTPKSDKK